MIAATLGALSAGLLGSPHCAGMCGGFATATTADGGAGIVPWHVGRLLTYAALGAIAGAAGSFVPGPSWVVTVVAILLLAWFSLRLAGWVPEVHLKIPGLTRLSAALLARKGVLPRAAFGMLTGLMPCGLVYAALGFPVALGDPLQGAAVMVVFGLGTVPVLSVAAVGLRKLAGSTPWVRRAVALGVLAAGVWSLGLREAGLVTAQASDTPACHEEAP